MPSNGEREPGEILKDKLRSIFSPKDSQKKKNASPPKAHFSIWYFLMAYERARQPVFLPESFMPSKTYSEEKAGQIDEEVTRFVEEAHQRVLKIVSERRNVLDDLARLVSQQEVVQGDELRKMLGKTLAE